VGTAWFIDFWSGQVRVVNKFSMFNLYRVRPVAGRLVIDPLVLGII